MKRILYAAAVAAVLSPALGLAQIERLTKHEQDARVATLDAGAKAAAGSPLAAHLGRVKSAAGKGADAKAAAVLASRVATDFPEAPKTPFAFYAVPAMSDVQRLADVYPLDGIAGGTVRIIAAKGEYEPGSFLVYPFSDLGKVAFSLTPFKTDKGQVFPADKLDLKFIKVWYQNKNGWYSYFGDTGFKLCPELLVNDEDLIRVDTEKKANYARLIDKDGKQSELWINPPRQMDRRFFDHYRGVCTFAPMSPDFRDAKTLQPVALPEGQFKNFFLTANVTKDIPDGLYKGAVKLTDKGGKALGEIPVTIKVLPFELPAPKAYFNPDKDFLTCSYSYISLDMIKEENGGDLELAKKQLEAVLRDQVEHNQLMHWLRSGTDTEGLITIDIMKKVGMRTDCFVGGVSTINGSRQDMEAHARREAAFFDKIVGHHNFYIGYGDEPSSAWLAQARPVYESYQKAGFKFIIAGGDSVFFKAGYLYDWHNIAKDPIDDSSTALWNQLDNAHIAWYAAKHVGPENPSFNRRQYGMAPYLAGYSASCNYAHHFGPYNDDRTTYKPMVFAYGIYDGVIDTLGWEGYREGMDDIRYATLMTTLARKAAKSKNLEIHYAGLKALQYLANFKRDKDDLNTCRLEMIKYILELSEMVKE